MPINLISNNNLFSKAIIVLSLLSLTTLSSARLICPESQKHDIAYHTDDNDITEFNKNMSIGRNANLKMSIKVKRIKNGIIKRLHDEHSNVRLYNAELPRGYDIDMIAERIAWASECTGNDFVVFAAIIIEESYACSQRTGGGQDSGCGQLSVRSNASVGVIKNQLRLSGQQLDNNANRAMRDSWNKMILSCFDNRRARLEDFTAYFNSSFQTIKNNLRRGTDIEIDLLAAAIYLKFRTALAGGYTIPGPDDGGIASYNGGGTPGYHGKIIDRVDKINYVCYEDTYTQKIESTMCEISPNSSCEHGSPLDEISI